MKTKHFFCSLFFTLFISPLFCYTQNGSTPDTVLLNKFISETIRYSRVDFDSTYVYAVKSLNLALKISSLRHISIAKENLGGYYENKDDFGTAIEFYLAALKIEEQRKDEKRIADLYNCLGSIYQRMEKFNKAIEYYNNAHIIYDKKKDTLGIATSLFYIGWLHREREFCETRTKEQHQADLKTALGYYEKSKSTFESIKNDIWIARCCLHIGACYRGLKQPEKALQFTLKAKNYYVKIDDGIGIMNSLDNLGMTYCILKQYNKSIEYYKQSIEEKRKRNMVGGLQFIYERMAQTYDYAGDYKNARDYYVKYMILRDSIFNSTKSQQIFELETKYQSEKKEKEILGLTLEKKNRGLFIFILSTVIIALILFGFFVDQRTRSKRLIAEQAIELREQKIKELEKERLLVATQSVLEGEEVERQRLARDLHDGLGGLLSGVKLSLNNMKGNVILSNESVNDFDHALGLLDSSINELRRVAHNMMPETLVKLGLKGALSDFCDNMNASNSMTVRFQFVGQFERLEQKTEIGIYRIIQELINNAVKHSQADKLIVQMVQEPNRLCLIVEDNGKGFDVSTIGHGKGIGLNSVKSRIETLNGRIDISSEFGKGSEFIIEFIL